MTDKQQMERDLIRATYFHEMLRSLYGPGNAALSDPMYVVAHSLMSKLARKLNELNGEPLLLPFELDAMVQKYKDLPEYFGFNDTIVGSC